MTYFLVFLAVLVAGGVAMFLVGQRRRETRPQAEPSSDPSLSSVLLDDGLSAPVPNLPPVLLPEQATAEDVDRVRFSLGLRGYRMDQVDQVLDRLSYELDARDERIAALEAQLITEAPGSRYAEASDSRQDDSQQDLSQQDFLPQPGSDDEQGDVHPEPEQMPEPAEEHRP
ncbi:DivIVA domain-containing protein [Psychromicrobium silvestre]|uniref:DivIVA domain-containing protein n=1 Tax=Psychromicrobium silvestre TaxID=1645614 RepID=A0A7Y9LT20_9MICC|nr:DivIVA domain-containing protein [Psychromicrobium silvestre]